MNPLTKMALGLIGQLRPEPPTGDGSPVLALPPLRQGGGLPLMQALARRQSQREFDPVALPLPVLSDLLWAAAGVNRPDSGGRTAPSAMNAQEVDLYVALPEGLYLYDPHAHALQRTVAADVRRVTGYQDFVDSAPLDLVYVADHARMKLVPAEQRSTYAAAAAGAMAQNVYLQAAAAGRCAGCSLAAPPRRPRSRGPRATGPGPRPGARWRHRAWPGWRRTGPFPTPPAARPGPWWRAWSQGASRPGWRWPAHPAWAAGQRGRWSAWSGPAPPGCAPGQGWG